MSSSSSPSCDSNDNKNHTISNDPNVSTTALLQIRSHPEEEEDQHVLRLEESGEIHQVIGSQSMLSQELVFASQREEEEEEEAAAQLQQLSQNSSNPISSAAKSYGLLTNEESKLTAKKGISCSQQQQTGALQEKEEIIQGVLGPPSSQDMEEMELSQETLNLSAAANLTSLLDDVAANQQQEQEQKEEKSATVIAAKTKTLQGGGRMKTIPQTRRKSRQHPLFQRLAGIRLASRKEKTNQTRLGNISSNTVQQINPVSVKQEDRLPVQLQHTNTDLTTGKTDKEIPTSEQRKQKRKQPETATKDSAKHQQPSRRSQRAVKPKVFLDLAPEEPKPKTKKRKGSAITTATTTPTITKVAKKYLPELTASASPPKSPLQTITSTVSAPTSPPHTGNSKKASPRPRRQRSSIVPDHEIAQQAAALAARSIHDPRLAKELLFQLILSRGKTRAPPCELPPPGHVLPDKFVWANYPPLEQVLRDEMHEYYNYSINACQSLAQQIFNNDLVKKIQAVADEYQWQFDLSRYTDGRRLRDRIRCYYKTHMQNAKKRLTTMLRNPTKKANAIHLMEQYDLIQLAANQEDNRDEKRRQLLDMTGKKAV